MADCTWFLLLKSSEILGYIFKIHSKMHMSGEQLNLQLQQERYFHKYLTN